MFWQVRMEILGGRHVGGGYKFLLSWWWIGSMALIALMALMANKPRIRNFPRISNKESETKNCESDTKIRESETKQAHESETKKSESETKSATPLNIVLNEILLPAYPHKGSKPATPSEHNVEKDIGGKKSATPSGHYVEWYITVSLSSRDQIRHPLWSLCWMGYYLQLIFRHQIRYPLWPLCWMRYYLQLIHIWDQIRHPL